jgi:hypothetical protein
MLIYLFSLSAFLDYLLAAFCGSFTRPCRPDVDCEDRSDETDAYYWLVETAWLKSRCQAAFSAKRPESLVNQQLNFDRPYCLLELGIIQAAQMVNELDSEVGYLVGILDIQTRKHIFAVFT